MSSSVPSIHNIFFTINILLFMCTGNLNVYLLDIITGHMVFQCSHKRVRGPVVVAHSENWIVVSVFTTTFWLIATYFDQCLTGNVPKSWKIPSESPKFLCTFLREFANFLENLQRPQRICIFPIVFFFFLIT